MQKILISRCFLGEPVRYDGQTNLLEHAALSRWQSEGRLVPICPEVAGGLPTPRPPAEIQNDGSVLDCNGKDVSAQFEHGARQALQLCRAHNIQIAILKQSSPSCGSKQVYDGRFSGQKVPGEGVTAALLRANGIAVFGEDNLEQAVAWFNKLDKGQTDT